MKKSRGQSTVEYVVLVTVIIGAFIGAGAYFKRGIQGRWKAAVDDLGDQYDPRTMETNIVHRLVSNTDTKVYIVPDAGGYWTKREDYTNAIETKGGYSRTYGY